jgi:isoamylase
MKRRANPTRPIRHQGKSFPVGATLCGGANFSMFAKPSRAAQLLLFDRVDDPEPSRVIDLDPHTDRNFHCWHTFAPGVTAGQLWLSCIGSFRSSPGTTFLLKPSALRSLREMYRPVAAAEPGCGAKARGQRGDGAEACGRRPDTYDWEGDTPLGRPFAKTTIYEMHAVASRGIQARVSCRPSLAPTLVDRKDSLSAGSWRQCHRASSGLCVRRPGRSAAPRQLLGIPPPRFFALHDGSSSRSDPLGAIGEFRDMIKTLHRAGIEVILDVVYNHIAEGNETGPQSAFTGWEQPFAVRRS